MVRIFIGFLVSPMVAVLVYTGGAIFIYRDPQQIGLREFVLGAFLMVGPWAYAIGLGFGLPLFLLFRKLSFTKPPVYLLSGGIAGLLAGLYLLNGGAHVTQTILCTLGGGISAGTFWYIVCRNPNKPLQPTVTPRGALRFRG
jgi:hypothetical protein